MTSDEVIRYLHDAVEEIAWGKMPDGLAVCATRHLGSHLLLTFGDDEFTVAVRHHSKVPKQEGR